ncbi:ER membrane protein complex subunit 3-like [Neodiprion virginianus]|uniref:ER membrane protein complex subunit 3-like n=1 Tax=Neodiprion virginianus TaxID=2961670 RepID=UPI001EE71931|nr:ER membrane protein complex subunit 3-like [Neodiprion virginianus]
MTELLLDPSIRSWVFLPLVVITLLVGVFRHYASLCLSTGREVKFIEVESGEVLRRIQLLRRNGDLLPRVSFIARKLYLSDVVESFLRAEKRKSLQREANAPRMIDPAVFSEMIKCNLTNVLPMVLVGGWINWTFSGFVTTKVPFPLTLGFKTMLQRGVELHSLDASWVSSASWYFLNVVGLKSVYYLMLGEDNLADGLSLTQEQTSATSSPFVAAYKGERRALFLLNHNWRFK